MASERNLKHWLNHLLFTFWLAWQKKLTYSSPLIYSAFIDVSYQALSKSFFSLPEAFCCHKICQNALAAWDPPGPRWESLVVQTSKPVMKSLTTVVPPSTQQITIINIFVQL